MKSKSSSIDNPSNLENQQGSSKSNFHPNSAYRSIVNKVPVKIKTPTGVVTRYINAMIAYESVESEENYRYLEAAKKEYKDFLSSNKQGNTILNSTAK
jgi:hypothetical protein